MQQIIGLLLYIAFFFLIMYLLVFLPQRKREKKIKEMLDSVEVGNEIITAGGIMGRIINIKDDEITIETGAEKTKIKIQRWAIKEVQKKPAES